MAGIVQPDPPALDVVYGRITVELLGGLEVAWPTPVEVLVRQMSRKLAASEVDLARVTWSAIPQVVEHPEVVQEFGVVATSGTVRAARPGEELFVEFIEIRATADGERSE